ncbi:MAG: hypothetical protein ABIF10_00660, partial [Candidatus Woesearchaeota archaeon]
PYKKSPRITILGYALDIVTAAVWDHSRKQEEPILYLGEYPTQIMLHQDDKTGSPESNRKTAQAIEDICRIAEAEKISFCMTKTIGSDDLNPKNTRSIRDKNNPKFVRYKP